jgi:hypothetical protein
MRTMRTSRGNQAATCAVRQALCQEMQKETGQLQGTMIRVYATVTVRTPRPPTPMSTADNERQRGFLYPNEAIATPAAFLLIHAPLH